MRRVSISSPEGKAETTKILTDSGTELHRMCSEAVIHISAGSGVAEARLEILPISIEQLKADAIFSLESLSQMAKLHGYRLVKEDG